MTERIEFYLGQRAGEELRIGAVLFSLEDGILGRTEKAEELLERIRREQAEESDVQEQPAKAESNLKWEIDTGGADQK